MNIKVFSNFSVVWGRNSILEADLLCTKYLYDNSSTWEAFVNVAGSEYPLTTNEDLVKQFLHSKTTLETGVTLERTVMADWLYDQRLTHLASNNTIPRPPPPFNLTIYKGTYSSLPNLWYLNCCRTQKWYSEQRVGQVHLVSSCQQDLSWLVSGQLSHWGTLCADLDHDQLHWLQGWPGVQGDSERRVHIQCSSEIYLDVWAGEGVQVSWSREECDMCVWSGGLAPGDELLQTRTVDCKQIHDRSRLFCDSLSQPDAQQ